MLTSHVLCRCALVVGFAVVVTGLSTHAGNVKNKVDKEIEQRRILEVSVRLDKQAATPDEVVRVTELVPIAKKAVVMGVGHDVYRIGDYDQKTDQIVLRSHEKYLSVESFFTFEGLPGAEAGSAPKDVTIKTPREEGFEIEFKPKLLGVYLIEARWKLKTGQIIYGEPVVLAVRPPRDAQGKPTIKAAWIPGR